MTQALSSLIQTDSIPFFHQGLPTEERIKMIADFNSKREKILVSTDASNRGINFEYDILIQYEFA